MLSTYLTPGLVETEHDVLENPMGGHGWELGKGIPGRQRGSEALFGFTTLIIVRKK